MRIIKQYAHIFFLIIGSLVLCLIGVFLYKFISTHQPPATTTSKPTQSSNEVSDDSPPLVSVLRVIGQVTVRYYSNTDESLAQTNDLTVYKDASDQITIQASIDSQGKTIRAPQNIFLRIIPTSKSNKYISNRAFKILLDEQLLFSKASTVGSTDKDKDKVVTANLSQEVPYTLFVKMTEARKVKLQVGPTTFELKESDVETFRDLLKTIEP